MRLARPSLHLACTVALALAAPALRAQAPAAEVPQLLVTGYGEVTVPPDRATIDVAVETRAATAAAAAQQNARRARAVMDTLRARGVAATDVSTVGYQVHPEYGPGPRAGQPAVRAYVAMNVVRVETARLDQVGVLIDATLAAGANRVNEVRFSSSRHEAMRDSATAVAIGRARQTAEVMARAAGGRLGALLELSTEASPYAMRERLMRSEGYLRGAVGASVANQTTSIAPDALTVGASVVARWRLEGAR